VQRVLGEGTLGVHTHTHDNARNVQNAEYSFRVNIGYTFSLETVGENSKTIRQWGVRATHPILFDYGNDDCEIEKQNIKPETMHHIDDSEIDRHAARNGTGQTMSCRSGRKKTDCL